MSASEIQVMGAWDETTLSEQKKRPEFDQFKEIFLGEGAKVSDEDKAFLVDETLLRYLRARKWDIKEAEKMLRESLAWRHATKPEQVICKACIANPRSHYMFHCGQDKQGMPVIYSCFQFQSLREWDAHHEHIVYCLEECIRSMPEHIRAAGQWTWIQDFSGMGLKDANPATAVHSIRLLSSQFPERLHQFVLLNSGMMFAGLWATIKPIVPAETCRKVNFVRGSEEEQRRQLMASTEFSDELIEWVLTETRENKDSKKVKEKRETWFRIPLDAPVEHHPRGPASHLKYLREREDQHRICPPVSL